MTNIPLATYLAAIRAWHPLAKIDSAGSRIGSPHGWHDHEDGSVRTSRPQHLFHACHEISRAFEGPRLALQVPLYPETSIPFETKAGVENHTGLHLETAGVLLFAWNYIPQGVDYSQPYITPLKAGNLGDLPPTILVTNGFDPLRDVGHAYARKLALAGNEITYVHHGDLTHGFIQFTEHSRRCLEATVELARPIRDKLGAR